MKLWDLFIFTFFFAPGFPLIILGYSRLAISPWNPPMPPQYDQRWWFAGIGYPSHLVMRNADTWCFANQYLWKFGKQYFFITTGLSEIMIWCIMLLKLNIDIWMFLILLLQLLLYIIWTPAKMNKVLNETFDKQGFRKDKDT